MSAAQPEIEDDGFAWVEPFLDTWARWMRHPALKLGAPSRTPAFMGEIRDGYGDPDEHHELAGRDRAIEVIESTLDECAPIERAAVMHVKLWAVFRFRAPVEAIYLSARQRIGIRLRANDFW